MVNDLPSENLSRADKLALSILTAISKIPIAVRQSIGSSLGYLFGLLPLRDQSVARLHLKLFLPSVDPQKISRRVFTQVGRTAMESINLEPLVDKIRTDLANDPGWDLVNYHLENSKGLVALTAHFGNWDLLGASLVDHGFPLVVVGKESRFSVLQVALSWIRARCGIQTLWRDNTLATRSLVEAVKTKKIVGALVDQDTNVDSVLSTFFGLPVRTPCSIIAFAKRKNAPLVSIFLAQDEEGRYHLHVENIDGSLSVEGIADEYNARLERLIRRYPTQWVWFHKRWRGDAHGVRRSGREYVEWLKSAVDKHP